MFYKASENIAILRHYEVCLRQMFVNVYFSTTVCDDQVPFQGVGRHDGVSRSSRFLSCGTQGQNDV